MINLISNFYIDKKKNLEFLVTSVTLSSGNLVNTKILDCDYIQHRYFPLDIPFLITPSYTLTYGIAPL